MSEPTPYPVHYVKLANETMSHDDWRTCVDNLSAVVDNDQTLFTVPDDDARMVFFGSYSPLDPAALADFAAEHDLLEGELTILPDALWSEPEPPKPPAPLAPRFWHGYDCPVPALSANFGMFPDARYMRDFGVRTNGVNGADLAPANGVRIAWARANNVLVHYSHKVFDPDKFNAWLYGLPEALGAGTAGGCMYTYHHEPTGNIEPNQYRLRATLAEEMIAGHPNGKLVLHNGPMPTMYNIAQGDGPQWMYAGATAVFADRYAGDFPGTGYPTPEWMFEPLRKFAAELELPWGIGEWGSELRPGTTPQQRADFIRACCDYLLHYSASGECISSGYWQNGGTAIAANTPEETALDSFFSAALVGLRI